MFTPFPSGNDCANWGVFSARIFLNAARWEFDNPTKIVKSSAVPEERGVLYYQPSYCGCYNVIDNVITPTVMQRFTFFGDSNISNPMLSQHDNDRYWGGAIKVYVYFIRRELLLKWPKNEKGGGGGGGGGGNHCYFGVSSGRNLAKTPPLSFLGQSQPVVGSMWKNEQFFGDLNFHKSEPHQAPIV